MENYLTAGQIAEKLQLNVITVLNAIGAGELEAVKIGNTYRISEEAIQAFIEKKKVRMAEGAAKE